MLSCEKHLEAYSAQALNLHVQCIFTLGTKNLGVHTKKGSGLIVMVSRVCSSARIWLISLSREWEVALGTLRLRERWLIEHPHVDRTSFQCLVSSSLLPTLCELIANFMGALLTVIRIQRHCH